MAYTPYNQALPDTSRYNIDPVLLDRLYQPSRQDPYQAGMLRDQNTDYYADPFGSAKKYLGFGNPLDETLSSPAQDVGLGGLFSTPTPQNNGGGGSDLPSRNAIQDREDSLRSQGVSEAQIASIMSAEQEARGQKMNSFLSLAAQGLVPGMGMMTLAQRGPMGYADTIQGNMRTLMGDTSGYQSPNTRQPGMPAEIVDAAALAQREREGAAARAAKEVADLAAARAAAQVSVASSGWDGGLSTDYTSSSNDNSGSYGSVDGGRGGWSGGYGGVW